jgi:hypothetical protein
MPAYGKDRRATASISRPRSGARCRSSVVEHSLGKGEVVSSILTGSTTKTKQTKDFLARPLPFPLALEREQSAFPPAKLGENPGNLFGRRSLILSSTALTPICDHVARRRALTCASVLVGMNRNKVPCYNIWVHRFIGRPARSGLPPTRSQIRLWVILAGTLRESGQTTR